MKMKYSFDWMKVGRGVGRQQVMGALLLLLTVVSCAIENDIPYPIVEGRITAFSRCRTSKVRFFPYKNISLN